MRELWHQTAPLTAALQVSAAQGMRANSPRRQSRMRDTLKACVLSLIQSILFLLYAAWHGGPEASCARCDGMFYSYDLMAAAYAATALVDVAMGLPLAETYISTGR